MSVATRESVAVTFHGTGQACNILQVFAFEQPVSNVSFSFLRFVLRSKDRQIRVLVNHLSELSETSSLK